MSEAPISEMSFEQAMAELERVVSQLEGGNVPLDQSIALYTRGADLKKHCEAKLRAAEEKVSQITFDSEGQPNGATPFNAG